MHAFAGTAAPGVLQQFPSEKAGAIMRFFIFRPQFAPHFAPKLRIGSGIGTRFWPSLRRTNQKSDHQIQHRSAGLLMSVRTDILRGAYLLGGMGLGASLMYCLDPDRGRRRRAMVRDELVRAVHEAGDALDKGLRDWNQRVSGSLIEAASRFVPGSVSDEVLTPRIRSALGRCVSYPQGIEVIVNAGHVTLRGPILERDVTRLLAKVRHMKGVKDITEELERHSEPGKVPDLQGKPRNIVDHNLLELRWTPAARLGAAVAGSFLAVHGATRRGLPGLASGVIGLGLLTRALKPAPCGDHARQLARGVDLQKTINIDAPLERVFKMLVNPENFPRFMSHVQAVKKLHNGEGADKDKVYRWAVIGPAGSLAHWDAELVKVVDNESLEWRTRPGSEIEHTGVARVDPTPYGGTRLHVRLCYRPPLGAIGVTLGDLFSLYPKHILDQDLLRLKSLLEQGKTTAHHEQVRLSDLSA